MGSGRGKGEGAKWEQDGNVQTNIFAYLVFN